MPRRSAMDDIKNKISKVSDIRTLASKMGLEEFGEIVSKFQKVYEELQKKADEEKARQEALVREVNGIVAGIPERLRDAVAARLQGEATTKPTYSGVKKPRTFKKPQVIVVDGKEYEIQMVGKVPAMISELMKLKGFETKDRAKFVEAFKKNP